MKVSSLFSHFVPTEITANLQYRARLHRRVLEDSSFKEVLWDACAADPIFYINAFGYTYDTRREPFTKLPFILYPYQKDGLLEILKAIQSPSYDLLIEKSRDTGASWLCCLAFEWMWHFSPRLGAPSFLMGSRDATYVDNAENPKSLFWKIDYFHAHLPSWLMPAGFNRDEHRRKMHLTNPANGAVIDGETTTKNFARGDRRKAIFLDEHAVNDDGYLIDPATLDATDCRLYNSTAAGSGNSFYDKRHNSGIKVLRFHWSDHPSKNIGLYRTNENGTLRILDKKGYPEDYKPILDGRLRSVAYDRQQARSSLREMAQEWDIDYQGSGYQFFITASVQEAIRRCARPSVVIGDLEYDSTTAESIRFRESEDGRVRLWRLLGPGGKFITDHRVILGVDVSGGTGASNSCLCGYDNVTNEKVLEYVNPYIRPEEFAKQAVAIARWLGNAYLVWESNGPGRQFGSRVMDLHYGNMYLRKREEALSKKVSQIPGWPSTKQGKLVLLGDYRDAIDKGQCINRSKEALEESLEYIFDPEGGVSHSRSSNKEDPSGAKANHGDRVMADALAWRGMTEWKSVPKKQEKKAPIGSLAWRMRMLKKSQLKSGRELPQAGGW